MTITQQVFILDEDPGIRESLENLLKSVELEVESFSSAKKFLDAIQPDSRGCLILANDMKEMSGLSVLSLLQERHIHLPILMTCAYPDFHSAIHAIKRGISDFLIQPFTHEDLLRKIKLAMKDDAHQRMIRERIELLETLFQRLTNREMEVTREVIQGKTSQEIAKVLGIANRTVEAHRQRIMKKTNARSVAELVRLYFTCYRDELDSIELPEIV